MKDKTIEIAVTVNLFSLSQTNGATIHIDSVTGVSALGKLGTFSIVLFYSNEKLQDVSCFKVDSGDYFKDISNDINNITDNIIC